MKKIREKFKSLVLLALTALLVLIPLGCDTSSLISSANKANSQTQTSISVNEDGIYDSKDEVALYIHIYNKLPSNYITKDEAKKLGWSGGSVEKYKENCCIGGSTFSNNEGLLPSKSGRTYKECDIDTLGKSNRGAKRIVYSNDGLIYYTEDHYESFTLLYGEE